MPTTRRRIAHGTTLPDSVWYLLAFGTGMNSHPDAELLALWKTYGDQVTERYHRQFPDQGKPFFLVCFPKAACGA